MSFFILVIFLCHFLSILRKYLKARHTVESKGLNSLLNRILYLSDWPAAETAITG